ncbi:dihydrolipoyllysine-residue acetyltransferase [Aestuariicella hydrocarbonica]|uniref:Dihydrolipoamide acetyltransferase component of pyruvate dehydrogenase complex n=1 Tax=Pseudomaricurvus hydrocarbonicus TaxID=1470433 RepID=A0A9E5JWI4_9GAMM|nr:dihydrolipoyllysine-residue acetyltransferase [Aestuariicella hydrocarbonica]NHO65820.1 dihydrolipoyllysine-residue acetyltransferase [Aestuariicella hydrocarbonica]
MSSIIELRVPDIGGAENVEVVELLVKPGDRITVEQELFAVETDKATMEIPSSHAGIIKELHIEEGSKVSEGSVIALLELAADETSSATVEPASGATEKEPSAIEQPSASKEPLANSQPLANNQSKIETGTSAPEAPVSSGTAHASPSVRKLARELEVPLAQVQPTGDKGRITRDDVFAFVKGVMRGQASGATSASQVTSGFPGLLPWPKVDFEKFGPVERRELSRIQKISGANLHRNWVTIPHVTNHEDADITELEAFRVSLNGEYERDGVKVTLVAMLIKACVAALKKFPEFNASIEGEEIVLKQYYHIGFAADTPNGLVVPVIRDADKKGLLEVAEEVRGLAAKARNGKLTAADMSGGCFSISSLGGIGGTYFTPIINAPEIAILGVGKARTQVTWTDGGVEPRLVLPMSLSWDHRAVDGAMAGKFNAYLASALADFRRISL